MKTLTVPHIMIKPSNIHGYGVFANKAFENNEVIEECYAILSTGEERELKNYYFKSNNPDKLILPTGFGLIYNHADTPNATCYFDEIHSLLIFTSLRLIDKHEEITISYGKTWFSDRRLAVKKIPSWRKLLRFSAKAPLSISLVLSVLVFINQWLHVLTAR